MGSKILGYIIALIGIVGLAIAAIPKFKEVLTFIPKQINISAILAVGLAFVIVGIVIVLKNPSSSKKIHEVPIYHGKEIVGYRRTHK